MDEAAHRAGPPSPCQVASQKLCGSPVSTSKPPQRGADTGTDTEADPDAAMVSKMGKMLGVKYMLLVGMLAWALRYAIFGMFPTSGLMLVLGIVLHGVCYDFFFVTGQLYTDRVAPREMRTSAQALVGLITYGAGMLVGNYLHGTWGDYVGLDGTTKEGWLADAQSFWLMPAGFAVAISALFFFTFWYKDEPATENTDEPVVDAAT